jgi:hypothetical protein
MTGHNFAISRRDAPEVCQKFPCPPIRGRRECRAPMRPIAACAMIAVERTRVSQVTPNHPAFPTQWFYGLYRALPGDRAFLPPSSANCSANLTPASGCQDHTSSPSASHAVRLSAHPRPPHPASRPRRSRNAPRKEAGPNRYRSDLAPPSTKNSEIQKLFGVRVRHGLRA